MYLVITTKYSHQCIVGQPPTTHTHTRTHAHTHTHSHAHTERHTYTRIAYTKHQRAAKQDTHEACHVTRHVTPLMRT
jgi:hypothetical protein